MPSLITITGAVAVGFAFFYLLIILSYLGYAYYVSRDPDADKSEFFIDFTHANLLDWSLIVLGLLAYLFMWMMLVFMVFRNWRM